MTSTNSGVDQKDVLWGTKEMDVNNSLGAVLVDHIEMTDEMPYGARVFVNDVCPFTKNTLQQLKSSGVPIARIRVALFGPKSTSYMFCDCEMLFTALEKEIYINHTMPNLISIPLLKGKDSCEFVFDSYIWSQLVSSSGVAPTLWQKFLSLFTKTHIFLYASTTQYDAIKLECPDFVLRLKIFLFELKNKPEKVKNVGYYSSYPEFFLSDYYFSKEEQYSLMQFPVIGGDNTLKSALLKQSLCDPRNLLPVYIQSLRLPSNFESDCQFQDEMKTRMVLLDQQWEQRNEFKEK